jgi:hypothetical protein
LQFLARLLVVLAVHVGLLALILFIASRNSPTPQLSGLDVMALPGARVTLTARIEAAGPRIFRPRLEGVGIAFSRAPASDDLPDVDGRGPDRERRLPEGERVGVAVTDGGGFARLEIDAPAAAGNYFYRIRLEEPESVPLESDEVYLVVSVNPAERSLIITDIDKTICETSVDARPEEPPEDVPPLAGAPAVLREQAAKHQIVYFSARPTSLVHRTRSWLSTHGFPAGPVFFQIADRYNAGRLDSEWQFKKDFIREHIKPTWKTVSWGIGNIEFDHQAYQTNGIPTILVGSDSTEKDAGAAGASRGYQRLPDWKAVDEFLKKS